VSRALVFLALLAAGCASEPAAPPAPVRPKHVVLVTIDTLRADRLGCYGGAVETPHLDRIARQGAMAPQASVAAPLTRPSHATMLTGLQPAEHGLRDNVSPPLATGVPTLAGTLKASGFATGAVVSAVVLSRQSGLDRGFDTYSATFDVGADDARFLNSIQRRGDGPTAEAIAWLEEQQAERSFLWLHLYDPHDPYEPPEPWATRYAGRPYDGEVAYADDLVGRLDAALTRSGRAADTLLVVTSDHGEGLGEHDESVHGFFVYESTIRVPFLARGPGIPAGSRLAVTARGVDLMPTVLDAVGVAAPARTSGRSLWPALRGEAALTEAPSYSESLLPLVHFGWSDLRALREGRWKYIQAPRPELYDLSADPGERQDLAAREPARVDAFRAALARQLAAEQAAPAPAGSGVPAELLEQLGALGYLGAGTLPAEARTGADPKDKIAEFKVLNRLMREGLLALRAGDHPAAAQRLGELLRRGVSSFEAHYYLARALAGGKRHREAAAHYEKAAERLPSFAAAHTGLAESRLAVGDVAGALRALDAGAAALPRSGAIAALRGQVLRRSGRLPEAIAAWEAALPLAPKDALVRVQLGEAYRDRGDLAAASRVMREALDLDPARASYWNAYGMVRGAAGDDVEAEKAFRSALERDGRRAEYAYNLGLVLARTGRPAEAEPYFRRAVELEPGFAAARARLSR
jgi:choline-sulfatase